MPMRKKHLGCDNCGALAAEIPEWTDEETLITCTQCGEPVGSIGEIRQILEAALDAFDRLPGAERDIGECGKPRMPRQRAPGLKGRG